MASPLENAIQFFKDFGLFDVVLPFLLIFSIVFAILEKTRILGTEKIGSEQLPKRNLNSMVSFVFALLVVATNKVVATINKAIPNVVLLLVVLITFLILVGVFATTGEFDLKSKHKNIYISLVVVILIFVIIIFLDALTFDTGETWLEYVYNYVSNYWSGPVVTSIIFLLVAIGAILFITSSKEGK